MNNSIGYYIRQLRKKKNMTINQLAMYSGVSSAHISRIERDLRKPSPDILKKLAKPLRINYEKLLIVSGYINPEEYSVGSSSDLKLLEEIKTNEYLNNLVREATKMKKEDLKKLLKIVRVWNSEK